MRRKILHCHSVTAWRTMHLKHHRLIKAGSTAATMTSKAVGKRGFLHPVDLKPLKCYYKNLTSWLCFEVQQAIQILWESARGYPPLSFWVHVKLFFRIVSYLTFCDSSITLDTQVTATVTVKVCNCHIQSLRQLRSSLPRDVAQSVICAVIGSQLGYCDSLYYGISNSNFRRSQGVQNAAARIVCQAPRRQHHSADLLNDLHWLPLRGTVDYKIAALCHKAVKLQQPSHLTVLLVYSRHTDSRVPWDHLHQTYCQHSLHRQTLLLVGSHTAPHRLERSSLISTHCWQLHWFYV